MVFARAIPGDECSGDWDFGFGVFGEGDADRIAQAIFEQRADARGGFDAPVFPVAGFCHPQMERVIHALGHHFVDQQAVRLNHHLGIAGFHGKHDVPIAEVLADPRKLEGGFDHAQGRVPVPAHDAVGQGAVVGADPHGRAVVLADLDQRREPVADAVEFVGVLRVRVFDDLELFFVRVIAGVHAHFFHESRCDFSRVRGVVNIGHQGRIIARGPKFLFDGCEVAGFVLTRRGHAHVFAPSADHANGLGHRAVGVSRVGRGHRLHANGMVAAEWHAADIDFAGFEPGVFREGVAVLARGDEEVAGHGKAVWKNELSVIGFQPLRYWSFGRAA